MEKAACGCVIFGMHLALENTTTASPLWLLARKVMLSKAVRTADEAPLWEAVAHCAHLAIKGMHDMGRAQKSPLPPLQLLLTRSFRKASSFEECHTVSWNMHNEIGT